MTAPLFWESHVSELSRQCMDILIGLFHCRHYLPDGDIKILVTALVLSRVRYFLTVYGNGKHNNFDELQKIVNFAVSVIFERHKIEHVTTLRERLRWMTPKQMTERQILFFTQNVLRHHEPISLTGSFVRRRDMRERSIRQDGLLHLPRPRTEAGRRRFAYRAPSLYNALSAEFPEMSYRCFVCKNPSHAGGTSSQTVIDDR